MISRESSWCVRRGECLTPVKLLDGTIVSGTDIPEGQTGCLAVDLPVDREPIILPTSLTAAIEMVNLDLPRLDRKVTLAQIIEKSHLP